MSRGTTFEANYGADRKAEDRPSYLNDRPGGSNSRNQESMWQTSNSEFGYDPTASARGGGGAVQVQSRRPVAIA
jgi:hypothetical protein